MEKHFLRPHVCWLANLRAKLDGTSLDGAVSMRSETLTWIALGLVADPFMTLIENTNDRRNPGLVRAERTLIASSCSMPEVFGPWAFEFERVIA